mgnify:CR=1 FL=1
MFSISHFREWLEVHPSSEKLSRSDAHRLQSVLPGPAVKADEARREDASSGGRTTSLAGTGRSWTGDPS